MLSVRSLATNLLRVFLGIGAVVPRQPKVALSNDPVERKLLAHLDAGKRKFSTIEDPILSDDRSSDEEEGETESRTKAFVKKKASSLLHLHQQL
ncbi:hypothetical protein L1987_20483 [Smallanthus sonchifolius]|uniref:Uncharacterized protein n=1 Tax=Smallanthus sonchifolius TaxID=185202 RepID=A0ACB9IU11_9ASTR|nr:hypothetical protein L1987_20483 [Smallanthus sonchifolius]